MLKCKEFYPADRTRDFAIYREYEPVESVCERINAWVRSEQIKVFNVETASLCGWDLQRRQQIIPVWYEE